MTLEEKASRLRALLGDAVFKEAVGNVREAIRKGWEDCKDPGLREQLWHRQAALTDLLNGLYAVEDNIKFESMKFAKIVSRK